MGSVAILTGTEVTKGSSLFGLLAVLLGSLSWAAGVVISPKVKLPSDPLGRTALPTLCGAAMLLIAAGLTEFSGDTLGQHLSAITPGIGVSDHVRMVTHFLQLAAAAVLAGVGSYAYLCESCGGSVAGFSLRNL